MPLSWVRAPYQTSPKLRKCMEDAGDSSRTQFEKCVRKVVVADSGKVEEILWETNGRWARVYVEWTTVRQKTKIVFDLEGEDVIDLISLDAANKLGP